MPFFGTHIDLFEFCNLIAHGRSEKLITAFTIKNHPAEEAKKRDWVKTRWDAFATESNAEQARQDIRKIAEMIQKASTIDDPEFFNGGGQFTEASLIERINANKRLRSTRRPRRHHQA